MVSGSTSALVIEWGPQNSCCQCLCSSCLLPLQEALKDQQVGLAHDPFKWLPLHWDLECVRFWVCPLESLLPTALPPSLPYEAPLTFKARCSGGLSFWCISPGLWSWCGAGTHPSFGRTSAIETIFLFVGHVPGVWGVSWLNWVSVPPTLSLWFLLYVFSWGKYFLLLFRSIPVIVAL